jgi:acetyltransferase-like isoleucine patch superfamily enzyme
MRQFLRHLLLKLLYLAKIDIALENIDCFVKNVAVYRINQKLTTRLVFVNEGGGGLVIAGNPKRISMDEGSYFKPASYVECTGGVTIGRYCHFSRQVTIFSTTHEFNNRPKIPYDEVVTPRSVVVKDFVWCGSNVTIVGGLTIGEGAIIGSGSVVTGDVPDYAIVAGNPARVIGQRDVEHFKKLKEEGKFF